MGDSTLVEAICFDYVSYNLFSRVILFISWHDLTPAKPFTI